ncbi:hypothetical protein GOP47_0020370 [Adiantum capillus-veneris]|uniref:Ubiquitin-like domain-containing protein n=1 Tax=Adiantum capillus-veneris TaxID=13818 RepID=A0A9D4UD48_ADICA|nr:hypothetical protein GOP47_0020370 [Adiantum capillus-veneris]
MQARRRLRMNLISLRRKPAETAKGCGKQQVIPAGERAAKWSPAPAPPGRSEGHNDRNIQLVVKTLTGKTITFEAKSSDTIGDVKRKLVETGALTVCKCSTRLILAGRELRDDAATLAECDGFQEPTLTLHLVLRLRGC